ncbi:MAG: hemolysin III family protein [Gammaproteobacteria bacterium]|nr:hemolysin III family protein [Gammaproteobacteria bacterium]MBI5618764.1 hemolysin III family protein [Gammaproteobacteria bacterium]
MNATPIPSRYSAAEELANGITHGLGVLYSIAGLAVLTAFASVFGTVWHIISCSIYGATQIVMYTASTLYHSVPAPRAKAVLRVIDHSAIFLLIAGTYTPFALVSLRGPWGWSLLGLVWGCALIGIALQGRLIARNRLVTTMPYVVMGWIAIVAIKPLAQAIAPGGLWLLIGGGLAYTLGTVFYVWRRLPFHHAIWHVFVLAGSALHFFAILLYVIPLAG